MNELQYFLEGLVPWALIVSAILCTGLAIASYLQKRKSQKQSEKRIKKHYQDAPGLIDEKGDEEWR